MGKEKLYILLIILFAITYIFTIKMDNKNIDYNIPEQEFTENEYEDVYDNTFIVDFANGINFKANETKQKYSLKNNDDNIFTQIFYLYLGDGTLIYQSPVMSPGDKISEIELKQSFKKGIYKNALMIYDVYNGDKLTNRIVNECSITFID